MNKEQLKELIAECINEVYQEKLDEAWFDSIKNFGKGSGQAIQAAWNRAKAMGDKDEQKRLEKQLAAIKNREPSTFDKIKKGVGGMLKGDGYDLTTPHPDSERAARDRRDKLTSKTGKFQGASKSEKGNLSLKAQIGIEKLKNNLEDEIKNALRNAYIEGESVGMSRKEVTQVFRKTLTGIFNKYKTLEEIADE